MKNIENIFEIAHEMWYNKRVENKKGSRTPDDQSESSAPHTLKGLSLL
nr:MAG TPA: hypothetical protein [Caudoviricetes sp.]